MSLNSSLTHCLSLKQDFTYKLKQDEIYTKVLEISVWDKDIGANDFIGEIKLSA